jgi:hypothetical protein
VDVLEAVTFKALHDPVGGLAEFRRRRQSRAVHIGEVPERIHYLRVIEGLGLDTSNQAQIRPVATILSANRNESKNRQS